MKKIPVIMDCDPGHDDAIALMLALGNEKIDVKAVTTSAGNQTPEKTLNNALRVLSFLGRDDIEVAQGALKPLMRDLIIAPEVHGDSGLDGPYIPEPSFKASERRAVDVIADVLRNSEEKVTLIPTGPLTNIATFLLTYPELRDKIERISLMGGAADGGNWTPAAEFNILVDPEAADVVFKSGVPIVMCGLDVTHKAQVYDEDIEKFRGLSNATGKLVAELLDFFAIFHKDERFGFKGAPLHDPCAVAYVIDPSIIETKKCHVEIETKGEFTLGATVVDYNDISKKEKNADVAFNIDREKFIQMIYDAVKNLR
ncbi:pyrimidine-specific ribonucleoside hydrolase RihA [Hathewaya limosa]|uniref:Pyrimidine-specific ribonucleoside hydrolase n=1 Tax=Hathewaya limosa TaxID=1536 RepID=A0ABU0JSJ7_HATLI|nr:pyrimidine-specific ribonucleoside hydrolase RihA [Hathewaya limosa]MDQ0480058.1 pyrimidine-specific ribonucleoside hydrolase [Hathewaya limosa]